MINSEAKLCHASKKVLATLRRLRCDYEVCHYLYIMCPCVLCCMCYSIRVY